jgi:two-component system OmpR family response regulator
MEGTRVLVVDDEANIRDLLAAVLRYEKCEVRLAETGREAVRIAETFCPDIVILDVMLPDLDGFEVHKRLRGVWPELPVLFLTARDSTQDKIHGLSIGADDYVAKPFSLEEVIARMRTILRRTKPERADKIVYADLEIDEERHQVRRGERFIDLTPTEFRLLSYLAANAGIVLSRSRILAHVWQYDFGGEANIVETYMSYLRKKVDADGETPLLQTVRGVGYTLRLPR